MIREQGGQALGYVDDITNFVSGEPNQTTEVDIDLGDKLGFIHVTGRRRNLPKEIQQLKLPNNR
jgi:hypothetical protein